MCLRAAIRVPGEHNEQAENQISLYCHSPTVWAQSKAGYQLHSQGSCGLQNPWL